MYLSPFLNCRGNQIRRNLQSVDQCRHSYTFLEITCFSRYHSFENYICMVNIYLQCTCSHEMTNNNKKSVILDMQVQHKNVVSLLSILQIRRYDKGNSKK